MNHGTLTGTRRAIAASVLGELRQRDTGFMHRLMAKAQTVLDQTTYLGTPSESSNMRCQKNLREAQVPHAHPAQEPYKGSLPTVREQDMQESDSPLERGARGMMRTSCHESLDS